MKKIKELLNNLVKAAAILIAGIWLITH